MNNSELTALFALTAAVSWGVSDFFGAKAAKNIGPVLSMLLVNILDLPVFAIFYVVSGQHWFFNGIAFAYALGAGLTFTVGSTLFFKGLDKGPVSIVSPVASMYPFITTLVGLVVFSSRLSLLQCVGIVLVLVGVAAASGLVSADKNNRKLTPGVRFAVATAIIWGASFSLSAQAIARVGWANTGLIETATSALIMPAVALYMKKDEIISGKDIKRAAVDRNVLLNMFIGLTGIVAVNVAISKSTASGGATAAAISSIYPIITILLALHHFKEKVAPIALSGAVLGIVGVVVLSLS